MSLINPPRPRVLSGMRPTGRLHLGNYMGALHNWVQLQQDYDCYFFIADLHALTTDYADPGPVQDNILEIALDFLSAGLDPGRCVIFQQSDVPQHAQLFTLFSMFTPLGWLERVPTYKDQQAQLSEKDLTTYGFLGYPLLQSADILLYKPDYVPVGADQVAHVELTREVVRRFNQLYPGEFFLSPDAAPWEMSAILEKARKLAGEPKTSTRTNFSTHQLFEAASQTKKLSGYGRLDILPEPQVLLTPSPKLPGLDGRKMSKSYKNTLMLSEPEDDLRQKLKTMVTDPARIRRDDPGNPDVCPVFDLHKVFSTEAVQAEVNEGCRSAKIGCIECKGWLANAIVEKIAPIQARRRDLEKRSDVVWDVLENGKTRAAKRAQATLDEVNAAMGLRTAMSDEQILEPTTTDTPAQAPQPFALEHPPVPPPAPEPKRAATDRDKSKDEASQSPFTIIVGQVYDGPLDLLLDLIRKQNIDIYDIPIGRITAQFLEYTHQLKETDVDAAGEFIYVASLLIHIKSKTLLPRDPSDVLGADAEDPRRELVERLLEHERFKAAAQMLQQKQMLEEATWPQPGLKAFLRDVGEDSSTGEREIDADTVDLVRVFQDILQRLRERPVHSIDEDSVTVAQMIDYVKRRLLMEDRPISLRRLLHNTRSERALICTFLAMLELVRLQAILLRQPEQLGDILVKKTDRFEQVFADQAQVRDDWG